MGGLGPGIGGLEILVIGLLALIVVGPKDLPMLLRKVGQAVGKARAMANEFRSSFDEMARQSELDELRKEVEALRTGQGSVGQGMVRLGDEANAAFKDIKSELEKTDVGDMPEAVILRDHAEFPEPEPTLEPLPVPAPAKVRKQRVPMKPTPGAEVGGSQKPVAKPEDAPASAPRPRASRKPKASL
ncbi:MAG: Sec-independent protein translocase protein TatB [Brevundimonas sp.]|uniref:Sec-independent protein translocase protein TatB n=1 Tax=Brevundimonas sp. TaxID=1871086 RepID=UPI0027334B15|nr:Sec-independent protein translocase protein TatB [Brevundimonas sp.]MDP3405864.1 Sec-independent protein translocase protein TatB [Brevundimonas sp.]